MFKSEIFNSLIKPTFTENNEINFNCFVEFFDKETKRRRIIDSINIQSLPYKESIITLAIVQVSIITEQGKINNKLTIQKELSKKKKSRKNPVTEDELKSLMMIPIQIENKTKKIKIFKNFEKVLENKISEFQNAATN